MKKNDLTAFKTGHKKQLLQVVAKKDEPKQTKRVETRRKPGPPRKLESEKANYKVMMSFTSSEEKFIKEQAGAVRVATFLKLKLQDAGVI